MFLPLCRLFGQGAPACPSISAGSPVSICNGSCTTLNATIVSNNQTTGYTVSSIPYVPYPGTGSSILVGADDVWSSVVNLGFNFCYFGNHYNQAVLGDNGQLTFDLTQANGYDNWQLTTALPNTVDLPANTICAAFRDIDQGLGGNSYIETLGSAPCRALVMSWVNVPLYANGAGLGYCDGTPLSTFQLVLYENTNYIDVYIANSFSCAGWNGGNGIIGLLDGTGTVSVSPPGRNLTAWSVTNEAWRFSPSGAPSYNITWTDPVGAVIGSGASVSVCPGSSGTYTATMQVTNCDGGITTYSGTVPVTVTPGPSTTVSPSPSVICNGGPGITLNAGGATTYAWSPAAGLSATTGSSVVATPGASTTYTVTGTTAGCTGKATAIVNVGSAATLSATPTNVLCNGGTGTATVTPTGGTAPLTYSWSGGGGTNPTTGALPAGTYNVTVTTALGCQSTTSATITQPSVLGLVPSATSATCGGANGSASVTVSGGTAGYAYNWVPAPGIGQGTASPSGMSANSYTVTVTDAHGCTGTATAVVGNTGGPTSTLGVTSNASCNAGCNGTATVNASGGTGTLTYSWSGNPSTTATATSLCAGSYSCTITDASGCQNIVPVTITQPAVLALTSSSNPATCGASNGQASVVVSGGTSAYAYVWSPVPGGGQGTSTATLIPSGTYSVVVTDANGCSTNTSVIVSNSGAPTVSLASSGNPACNGACTGTATVSATGGVGTLTYSWTPNVSATATGSALCAGTAYTCYVTDANGCLSQQTVTLTQPTVLSISASNTPTSCNSVCDGTATASPSGGTGAYTYSWSPNISTLATATALCAGSYTCFVTDANGCPVQQIFGIAQPPPLVIASSSTKALCNGACSGTATANPSGGTGAYTYSWSPNIATTPTATALCAGSYTCTVKDANGCSQSQVVAVVQPAPLSSAFNPTSSTCKLSNGSLQVTPAGGTGTYTYAWSPAPAAGQTTATANGLTQNFYTCIITDSAGCTLTVSDSVTNVGVKPVAGLTASAPVFCFGGKDTLKASGGTSYLWNNGSSANPLITSLGGTYVVYATNSCGTDSARVTITLDSLPRSKISGSANICNGQLATLSASGGGTYAWNTGATTSSITTGSAGNYSVGVTNFCGTDSAHFTVNVNTVTAGFTSSALNGVMPLPVNFTDTSSANATSWSWSFGDGGTSVVENASHTYLTGGNYTVILTVKDSAGCISITKEVIDVTELPSWLVVPNVFSPNNDGVNDVFIVRSQGITQFDCKIYDRWGVEMIELTAPGMGWDGYTSGGGKAVSGTYFYILHAKGDDGKVYDFNGFLMLIRE